MWMWMLVAATVNATVVKICCSDPHLLEAARDLARLLYPANDRKMAAHTSGKVYIVEHLDPELGPWSELEYISIAEESQQSGSSFTLSSLPDGFKVPEPLKAITSFKATQDSVEDVYAANKNTVCLLDPSAEKDLSPEDAQEFGVFLFGGILGKSKAHVPCYATCG